MTEQPVSLFTVHPDSPSLFLPSAISRSPWAVDTVHGGVGSATFARSLERLLPDQRLSRLTVDLLRPYPMAGFEVEVEVLRGGRSVTTTVGRAVDQSGRVVARATALHQVPVPVSATTSPDFSVPPGPDGLDEKPMTDGSLNNHEFDDAGCFIMTRTPVGGEPGCGTAIVWLRLPNLIEGEDTTPWQRSVIAADCCNWFGRHAEPSEVSFVNPDLTVHLHRDPVGEWIGLDITGRWEANGVGLASAVLFDTGGPVGKAAQTLLLRSIAQPSDL
ncbi:MAG: hypothetical protein CL406_08765 [Acidimicrobiaceae bacterium]|jgi:hypothetical protein|nr:hypothetical protein [Acidimicrobiaceae bacterium]MDP6482086.1 thioesterase family protein [Acidimicrobiales bacterium]MDP6697916.1 thioesterase family protein [Acidimicrobiales bacterium]|tara:strand:- start:9278 stop:10096 length:819 start_codon:yes stop_codon:yes gene_type:complete